MTDVIVNRYNDNEVQHMMLWCKQNLRAGSWQVKFSADMTTFVFQNKRDSFLFVCKWPQ
jgi:hypothetical protein